MARLQEWVNGKKATSPVIVKLGCDGVLPPIRVRRSAYSDFVFRRRLELEQWTERREKQLRQKK